MPRLLLKPRSFPIPSAVRGLVESVFPPDDLGIEPPVMGVLGKMVKPTASRLASVVPDLIEQVPVKQIVPSLDDVEALLGDLKRNLARVPQARGKVVLGPIRGLLRASRPPIQTLGETNPEFTPVGAEWLYNSTLKDTKLR